MKRCRMGQLVVFLLGSIAFGLIVTSFTTLYYVYIQKDKQTALLCVQFNDPTNTSFTNPTTNSFGTTIATNTLQTKDCHFKITGGMITLWTLGVAMYTLLD